jgi:hypothetical protein
MGTITEKTTITLSILVFAAVLGFIAKASWDVRGILESLDRKFENVERHIGAAWTLQMERDAWAEAAKLNPGLVSPNIVEIKKNQASTEPKRGGGKNVASRFQYEENAAKP